MKKFILIFLFALLSISYAQDLEKVSIQLKWFHQYQFAGIYMAKEKGFYADAGLDVSIKERDPKKNNILQVVNGESEYGIADSVILRYRVSQYPVKVLATIFQHNAMVLISKKTSGIVSPYEMKGKRISFQKGLDDSIISSLLSFANLEEKDYITKAMDFSKMNFVNDEVDITEAYLSIEPYWLKKKYGIEVNVIDPRNYGIDFYGDLIFTTQKEIDQHPLRVKAFKEASLKGWAYALAHQDKTIQVILDKYNTQDLHYEQLLYEARITENLIAAKYIPLGDVKKERFQVLSSLYTRNGLSKQKLDNAVQNLIYSPDTKKNWIEEYSNEIIAVIILFFIVIVLLSMNNKRLTYLVETRTQDLKKITQDQTELLSLLKEQGELIAKKAYIDGLTQVYNRNKFDEIFEEEFKSVQRYKNPMSLAIIDIDKFKDFNDTHGHLIGDKVLLSMAQTVNKNVRTTDTFARWGGEEFILLFKNTNLEDAKEISLKLKDKIEENEHKEAGKITASFGVTEYKEGDTLESIFKRCDEALYLAKENGRNRVESL